jgi:integrase/recombinase XerD
MHIDAVHELFQLQARANGRSVHTRKQYARHVRMLARWLADSGRSAEIEKVDHVAVAEFLCSPAVVEKRGGGTRRATSANGIRSSLRSFFAWAHAAGYAPRNAAALVRRARCGSPPPRALSEEDQRRLIDVLAKARDPEGRRDHALFLTMLRTGIRVGSAVALDAADFGNGELLLRKTKGDRPDRVFLPKEVSRVIEALLGGRSIGPLFAARSGDRITTRQVARRLRGWLDEAGIRAPASPHTLRHSFATGLYRRTGDVLLVKEALLHRSLASTAAYARVGSDRVREAVGE